MLKQNETLSCLSWPTGQLGRRPSNAQGHFACSYTYLIRRLALWQNHCRPECLIFFTAAVAYPSNFSICNASCMFQMIRWHLLLRMLCAHVAVPSTGDAVAALELLQQSRVTLTIKTEAQIRCSLSAFCRISLSQQWAWLQGAGEMTSRVPEVTKAGKRIFTQVKIPRTNWPKRKQFCYSVIHQFATAWRNNEHVGMVTTSKAATAPPDVNLSGVSERHPPAENIWHLSLNSAALLAQFASKEAVHPPCQQIVPHADHQAAVKLVNLSVSTNFNDACFHVKATTSSKHFSALHSAKQRPPSSGGDPQVPLRRRRDRRLFFLVMFVQLFT